MNIKLGLKVVFALQAEGDSEYMPEVLMAGNRFFEKMRVLFGCSKEKCYLCDEQTIELWNSRQIFVGFSVIQTFTGHAKGYLK